MCSVSTCTYNVVDFGRIITLLGAYHRQEPIDFDTHFMCHDGLIRSAEATINMYNFIYPPQAHPNGSIDEPVIIRDDDPTDPHEEDPYALERSHINHVCVDDWPRDTVDALLNLCQGDDDEDIADPESLALMQEPVQDWPADTDFEVWDDMLGCYVTLPQPEEI